MAAGISGKPFDRMNGKQGLAGTTELAGWIQAVARHGKTERKGTRKTQRQWVAQCQ